MSIFWGCDFRRLAFIAGSVTAKAQAVPSHQINRSETLGFRGFSSI
jgi:hypothetical protein